MIVEAMDDPYDATFVVIACLEIAARETKFFVSTRCDQSVDRHLEAGPTVEAVDIELTS